MFDVLVEVLFGRLMARIYHPHEIPAKDVDIHGKVFVVTGCTNGIGAETAKRLLACDAHVIMACRNTDRAHELLNEWKMSIPDAHAHVLHLDLAHMDSVRKFVKQLCATVQCIDCLINNAGIFDMLASHQTTEDGYELHFQVNYLAPMLLTSMVLDLLSNSKNPRIVNVSSLAHKFVSPSLEDLQCSIDHSPVNAYGRSKLYQIMATREMQHRLVKVETYKHIKVYSLHPGTVVTEVARTLPRFIIYLYKNIASWFMMDTRLGSDTTVFVATDPALDHSFGGRFCLGEFFMNCVSSEAHPATRNSSLRAQLWHETEKLLGTKIVPSEMSNRSQKL
eukprot:gene1528-4678_t